MARTPPSTERPSTPQALEDPLVFPATGVLARVPDGAPADYTLLAGVKDDDITLLVKCPAAATYGDILQLLVGGVETGNEVAVDPYLPDQDVPLVLPAASRPPGRHALNYKIVYRSAGGAEELGPSGQQFIVDLEPAGGDELAELHVDPALIADGVTPDELSSDAGGNEYLPATVLPYLHKAWGDLVQGLLDDAPIGTPEEVPQDVNAVLELRFPRGVLEASGDGPHDFAYTVEDRAGNISRVSLPLGLVLRLKHLIPGLLPPVVPGAQDGLVTDGDTRVNGGVAVEIPGHASIEAGDTIVLRWNAHESAPVPVDASQVGLDPLMSVTALYGNVYDDWFAIAGDADMDVVADVSYRVERAGSPIGEPASPTEAPVNLFGAGGKDPHPETPEHENLLPPSVQGTGGGPVNVIPGDELDNDAIATIADRTAREPVPAFRKGDRIQLYWDGTPVDEEAVVDTIGVDIKRTIPASVLEAHSPGTWNVHYTVKRALATVPFFNVALSPVQTVEVMDAKDLPGGGTRLAAARWVEGYDNPPVIDIEEARSGGGTPLRIYEYANMAIGDEICAKFLGYDGTQYPPDSNPVPESAYEVVHHVVAGDLIAKPDDTADPPVSAVYVDILIPTDRILPIVYGRAHFDYTVRNKSGIGTAQQAWVYVSVRE